MRTAQELFERAATILLDEGVFADRRTSLTEMCRWLNDGMTAIATQKPSAFSRTVQVKLVKGTLQNLPEGYISLLRPVRNIDLPRGDGMPRRIISVVDEQALNNVNPYWHDERRVRFNEQAKHLVYDASNPKQFYVYPGNDGRGVVELVLVQTPLLVRPRGDAEELASYAYALELDDTYFNALVDWVLYRAYSKDAQNAGQANRAQAHYMQYAQALGIKVATDANASPNRKARVNDGPVGVAPSGGQ